MSLFADPDQFKNLFSFDKDQLKQLMAQWGATPEDTRDANKQAALVFGLLALQGRKGNELATLGQAGLGAVGARQQALSGIPAQKLAALGGASKAMELSQQLRMQKDLADFQNYQRGLATGPQQAGPGPSLPALPSGPPPLGALGGSSTLPPPGTLPPLPQQQAPAPVDPYMQLMQRAELADAFARSSGNQAAAAEATKLREQALKWREKMAEPKVVMVNGKPTFQRFGEYGGQQGVRGDVPPDIQMLSLGDRTQAIDKLRVQPGQTFQQGQGPDSKASNAVAWANQNLSERKFRYEQEQNAAGAGPAAKITFANENTLRDEFNRQSVPFITTRDAYRRVKSASEGESSGAGDIALLYGYMKVLDPGSTVREGEFATAQNSGGIPGWIQAKYNGAINGERLSESMRSNIVKQATGLYSKAEEAHKNTEQQYRTLAERNKLNPENVIVNYRIDQPQAKSNIVDSLPINVAPGTRARDTKTGQIKTFNGRTWE